MMNDIEELLNTIYLDIRKKNTERSLWAIPHSDEFYESIIKKYQLIPFGVPTLIKILVDAHKIFQFTIIEADHKERIRRVDGFVVTEGNIIKDLTEFYSDQFIKSYSGEFSKKLSIERTIKEFLPKIKEYNNTELGIIANIVLNLLNFQSVLERNIMQYGLKWQEKQLKIEIEKGNPLTFFIDQESGKASHAKPQKAEKQTPVSNENDRRATDSEQYEDFKKYSGKYSIEKTLSVYGMEFYTRVCFREYQFSHIYKLVEDEVIKENEELLIIKKFLQKERSNSDKDLNLQKYANEINNLEKLVNSKIKKD